MTHEAKAEEQVRRKIDQSAAGVRRDAEEHLALRTQWQ